MGFNKPIRSVIHSDSMAASLALRTGTSGARPDLLQEVYGLLTGNGDAGLSCCVFVGDWALLEGNEMADLLAKESISKQTI